MAKIKCVLETLYMCIALMFFSKELINGGASKYKRDFTNSDVSV
jgi:hypothetical protein